MWQEEQEYLALDELIWKYTQIQAFITIVD